MTEKEFHAARRMWAVTEAGVMIAAPGDTRTHYEWLGVPAPGNVTTFDQWFNGLTRGYVLDGRLVAYTGPDFSRWVPYEEVVTAYDALVRELGPISTICLGARFSATEMPWPVIVEAPAEQFIAHARSEAK